jgi:cell division protein FtsL
MSRNSGKGRRVSLGAVLGQIFPVLLCFGPLASVGILHVASRSQVVDAAYRLSALEAESRTLALANDRLKLELATLKRPARLEAIARGQLGMAPPDASVVDSVAARPAPPTPHAAEGRRTLASSRSPR